MYCKTHLAPVSLLAAAAGKVCGSIAACVLGKLKSRRIPCDFDIKEALEEAEKVYKKPVGASYPTERLLPEKSGVDVSVVIPAYNAEKYLIECVDSVLNRSKRIGVQVIVVDDGSTDSTPELLKKYSDNENVEIVTQENSGSAANARNAGLLRAEGKYVMFTDSDDILLPGAIEKLYDAAEKNGSDIVQGGWKYVYDDGSFGYVQEYVSGNYTGEKRADIFDLPGMPWAKIYKRELFESIRFPSGYTSFEDAIIHFLVFRSAKVVSAISDVVYAWRKNSSGITSTSQGKPRAMQAYWITEELLKGDGFLALPHDELYRMSLIMELSNYCSENIEGLSEETRELIFKLCARLYGENRISSDIKLPYALRIGEKALLTYDFGLWTAQGKLFRLMR